MSILLKFVFFELTSLCNYKIALHSESKLFLLKYKENIKLEKAIKESWSLLCVLQPLYFDPTAILASREF